MICKYETSYAHCCLICDYRGCDLCEFVSQLARDMYNINELSILGTSHLWYPIIWMLLDLVTCCNLRGARLLTAPTSGMSLRPGRQLALLSNPQLTAFHQAKIPLYSPLKFPLSPGLPVCFQSAEYRIPCWHWRVNYTENVSIFSPWEVCTTSFWVFLSMIITIIYTALSSVLSCELKGLNGLKVNNYEGVWK